MSTLFQVLREKDEELAKQALAARIDGEIVELSQEIEDGAQFDVVTWDDDEGKKIFRHTASHILAEAVKNLYPTAKLAIGPAIDNGFYYDFDMEETLTPDALKAIEKEMKKIVKKNTRLEKFTLPRNEAIAFMKEKDEPYKVELIEDLPEDAIISFYKQGDFVDLCAGPHLNSTGKVKAYALTQVASAYWRGSEKNKMLQRIYGTAFPTRELLEEYLTAVEEAKKRDHNILGRKLELFTTNEAIGQGLPLIMPKGAKIIQTLQRWIEDEEEKRGYVLTKTPYMAKSDLYKISGHWDHYRDGMFIFGNPDAENEEVFALRPMTCPFQYMIYKAGMHSYRDLPIRYGETSTLFRNEASGEMHGLIRVRQFTISEGHLIVRPDQLGDEIKGCVDLINYCMTTLGIQDDVTYRFSRWDPNNKEKYIDMPEEWERTENRMREILNEIGIEFTEEIGEAAFYGPKLDIQFKNVHGKEDTIITVQADFSLAERFDMYYIDKDNEKKRPYIIHRTSVGCYERTLAMLIEKYAGAFPTWLAPVQAKILTISDAHVEYAEKVMQKLKDRGVMRVEIDDRGEKLGYKIREAQMNKIPYMLIVGDKDVEAGGVSVRSRRDGDLGSMSIDECVEYICKDIAEKRL